MKHRVNGNRWLFMVLEPYTAFIMRLYYRQFKVKGFEKVPTDKAVILAPNHQNAFMDAIVFLPSFGAIRQLSYLVRASIFGTKLGDAFLYRVNMMPVYRQIDGVENLGKNDEIFENCVFLLENKRVLTLFPEGTHHIKNQMLPLKKGITRIAFSAEERNNFNLDIVIIPAGIFYTRLSKYGGNVLIQFGDPIKLKDYEKDYNENPNKAHNLVKTKLSKALSDLMIDIKNSHYYDCIKLCCEMDANEKGIREVEQEFLNSKRVIASIDNLIQLNEDKAILLKSLSERYSEVITKYNLRDKPFSASHKNPGILEYVFFSLFSPVGIICWINNYPAFKTPEIIAEKKIKDPGFKSSIKSAAAMLIFPVFYFIQALVLFFILPEWWMSLIYLFSLPIAFFIGVFWRRKWLRLAYHGRFERWKKNNDIKEALEYRKEMIAILKSL
jgi:1-acyl-sn-glycerol-3-phosphate acyltransferase